MIVQNKLTKAKELGTGANNLFDDFKDEMS
jgi:hypothetical protein